MPRLDRREVRRERRGPGEGWSAQAIDRPLKVWLARVFSGISPASLALAHADWATHLLVSPGKQAELAASAGMKAAAWMAGLGACAPTAADPRFARPGWDQAPFSALASAFLLAQAWWEEATHGVRGVAPHHEDVAAFVARQLLDMLSPSNFPWTNPEVLGRAMETGGANVLRGWLNLLRDVAAVAQDRPAPGLGAFRPGDAVALSPGAVVARNHLAELIQYEPSTPRVAREPVLLVPSWIMKFYILDLVPQASLVRHLVDRGHTVFMVSWRNPGPADAWLAMDDYLRHGVLDMVDAATRRSRARGLHLAGYCLGGTLAAIAAAHLAAGDPQALRSLTLLAAQVDFGEPGELGLFVDDSQIAFLEDLMSEHGYLDGRRMAGAFQLINSKDLVWSKLVHEYLMGGTTPLTALRAWNADATRMPASMHGEYLRRLYLRNDLAEGRYAAFGRPVDLDAIRVPLFVLATERDHVSPWKSVWKVLRLAQHAPSTFVLASGGHNVGIVNPPAGPMAHPGAYFRRVGHLASAPVPGMAAIAGADVQRGSWWPAWSDWLAAHAGGAVRARRPRPLLWRGRPERAPGRYVHQA